MGKYQLEYFNNYDLAKATSSKLISLTGTVPPHGYFVVSDDSFLLCYQQTVDSVSLGLSSTAGLVEVLAYSQSAPGSSATPVLQDFVGWSKTVASGAQILPSNTTGFLQRLPVDSADNPSVNSPGAGSWQGVQPSAGNPCNFVTINTGAVLQSGDDQLLPPVEPAATIINQTDDSSGAASVSIALPPADAGLMSPMITEVLPNPAGTGNDATDEFIEVYNPNPAAFDLSGFGLQTGTTSLHDYTFPAGTSLPAQSFTAFYSAATGLSQSNSGGQVKLLGPSGNQLSATAVYGKAGEGQSWALANGQWYWTTKLTPGAPNVIVKPAVKSKGSASSKSKSKKSSSTKVKAAKTKKTKTALASSSNDSTPATTPIHTSALAVVAGLALIYGAYEYRADLANRFHRLKRNFKAGGDLGP